MKTKNKLIKDLEKERKKLKSELRSLEIRSDFLSDRLENLNDILDVYKIRITKQL